MGILADGFAIIFGGLFGTSLQKRGTDTNHRVLAICIMLVSIVGFLENVYYIKGENIVSENLLVVLFAFFVGSKLGDLLRLEEKLSLWGKTNNRSLDGCVDAALFFGVGGLQISGPVLWALTGDNSQLFIKSMIDLPFAVVYGAAYGKIVSLAALPVILIQALFAVTAYFFADFLSGEMIAQLCAMGYIILFFSGFNLITEGRYKINNINMLPSVFLVVLFHFMIKLTEMVL